MIYLFVCIFVSIYLYISESIKSKYFIKQFIVWLPAFFVFVLPLSFQYQVGTDYDTYFNYYFDNGHFLHRDRGELLYYYVVVLTIFLGDPQIQFFIVSIIQGLLFFYLLFLLKGAGYKSWLIFLLFYLCTGIYHNQMNGLRQFICIYLFLISTFFIYQKKYMGFLANYLVGVLIHISIILPGIILLLLNFIKSDNKKKLFLYFILGFLIYLPDYTTHIFFLLDFFNLRYISYADSKFAEGRSFSAILAKFYYLPLILMFWYYYIKENKQDEFFSFLILIFSLTYFMFLQALDLGMISRVWQYFNFFIIFPLYYLFNRCNQYIFVLLLTYILIFYIYKVVFFADAEYGFNLYRGWF